MARSPLLPPPNTHTHLGGTKAATRTHTNGHRSVQVRAHSNGLEKKIKDGHVAPKT